MASPLRFSPLALLLILTTGTAWAQTDHYVTTPAALEAAIRSARPGDFITLANGTWTDLVITFDTDGAPGDTITLRAETPGEVLLTGTSRLQIAGDYLKVDGLRFEGGALPDGVPVIEFRRSSGDLANHSRLTNCTVVDYNPPSTRTEYKWVSVYGRFNRVDHCYFAGKTNEGALLVVWLRDPPDDAPPEHRIDHNHFGPRPEFGDNGAETIRIGTSARSMQKANVVVERNLFTETNGEIEIISNKSGGNVYRGNTFRRARGTLTLRHGNGCLVEGNFFFGEGIAGTGGVRIIGEDHRVVNNYFQDLRGTGYYAALSMVQGVPDSPLNRYFQVKRAVVAHNTFVNTEKTFVIGVGASADQSLPPEDITVVNNVVQTYPTASVLEIELAPVGETTWAGNIVYGRPDALPQGFTFADPGLEQGADGLYRPGPASPVLDAADPAFAPEADMDGQPRDARAPDAGADEHADAPVLYTPLTPADVGPAWRVAVAVEAPWEPRPSRLAPSFPNPFDSTTTVSFTLEQAAHARLRLYDIAGREVLRLLDQALAPGLHEVALDGRQLPTGTYVLVLETNGRADYRLITILRTSR
ncbi:T9SS type A sorting domain-containing protein [Rhodocaloribacter litoris]|uniref:chondroitinase-B domain-containing protein n=1 Tax=Rhodocaloribacter litoris TaxID=2558931 RepID=UPI0014235A52|nr:chondroitinase-B domain-containing protein [Rhodocaloribacter litoris]QXD14093.1 T9SS type A sorting domain-containing protein [Rhodocaloribacter litoris]